MCLSKHILKHYCTFLLSKRIFFKKMFYCINASIPKPPHNNTMLKHLDIVFFLMFYNISSFVIYINFAEYDIFTFVLLLFNMLFCINLLYNSSLFKLFKHVYMVVITLKWTEPNVWTVYLSFHFVCTLQIFYGRSNKKCTWNLSFKHFLVVFLSLTTKAYLFSVALSLLRKLKCIFCYYFMFENTSEESEFEIFYFYICTAVIYK